jgi:hypothetical protein
VTRAVVALALLACSATASAASRDRVASWGKPGIHYDQYRADSVECAKIGYFRDVAQDEPAKRFIRGFETADRLMNFPSPADAGDDWMFSVRRTQPDRQKQMLQAIQVGDVEQCLTGKGYRKFMLTTSEEKALRQYPRGSEARHRYLHTLAAR